MFVRNKLQINRVKEFCRHQHGFEFEIWDGTRDAKVILLLLFIDFMYFLD